MTTSLLIPLSLAVPLFVDTTVTQKQTFTCLLLMFFVLLVFVFLMHVHIKRPYQQHLCL